MPENPSRRVCVIWPRFGPYHFARLNGAHRSLRASGAEVVGLEVASRDATYEWRQETRETPWRREVALPGRVYEDVPGPEMEDAVTAALDRIAPDAVAAMTYATPDARAALRWARRQRRTAVMMSETRETDAERSLWREAVKRALVRQYDAALVGGTPHRAYAASLGIPPEAIASPYDVVDNDFFAAGADAARREPLAHRASRAWRPAPFFLACGRFVARKNLDGLLAAYARIARAGGRRRPGGCCSWATGRSEPSWRPPLARASSSAGFSSARRCPSITAAPAPSSTPLTWTSGGSS